MSTRTIRARALRATAAVSLWWLAATSPFTGIPAALAPRGASRRWWRSIRGRSSFARHLPAGTPVTRIPSRWECKCHWTECSAPVARSHRPTRQREVASHGRAGQRWPHAVQDRRARSWRAGSLDVGAASAHQRVALPAAAPADASTVSPSCRRSAGCRPQLRDASTVRNGRLPITRCLRRGVGERRAATRVRCAASHISV